MRSFLPLLLSIVFLVSACTSEKQQVTETPSPVTEKVTLFLEIQPLEATRETTFGVTTKGVDWSKVQWFINDKPVEGVVGLQFRSPELKKGDRVFAKAKINDTEVVSNQITIKNILPTIDRANIIPSVPKANDILKIDVVGNDRDGDSVSFLYEWSKNGESSGRGETLEGPFKRGDKFSVKITPFDGESYGRPIVLHREIRNMHPTIIEDKKFVFDGKVWSYQVKATDPDGDTLTYSLKTAPAGMTIDSSTGLIKWNVPPEFIGKVPITISVTDGHGGETLQSFNLEIMPEKK